MRTTLDIDEDVLRAAKEIARRQRTTAGAVISELTRKALTTLPPAGREQSAVHGFRPFPARGTLITNDLVDKLREEDVY